MTSTPFGLYVHWPFCLAKCPYCDFNSHVRATVDHAAWEKALLAELQHWAAQTPNHILHSIFFGGGTPSLMTPHTVGAVITAAQAAWSCAPKLEITLEANPTSVEANKFAEFRAAGVNRVSLGIQAFNDADLKMLGRQHSVAEAKAAIKIAQNCFNHSSFDLIYARPHQTVAAWRAELQEALSYTAEHLSLYQLTIEDNTGFKNLYDRGQLAMPDAELAGALYEETQNIMQTHHLPAYEISNHAQAGAACQHNLLYWQYDDYIGIGPGAHGRVQCDQQRLATVTEKMPERWLKAVQTHGHGLVEQRTITNADAQHEALLMGLRLTAGIDRAAWQQKFGTDILTLFKPTVLQDLTAGGFITVQPHTIAATATGRQRLNAVLDRLLN